MFGEEAEYRIYGFRATLGTLKDPIICVNMTLHIVDMKQHNTPRLDADLGLGESCSSEPSAELRGDLDIEKSDLHSRGGRLSVSLTEPVQDRARDRSLTPDDGLESPENGVRERECDRCETERIGVVAPNPSNSFLSHPGAGWIFTHSSLPCATPVVPVGMGSCVTAGDPPGGQPGIGC